MTPRGRAARLIVVAGAAVILGLSAWHRGAGIAIASTAGLLVVIVIAVGVSRRSRLQRIAALRFCIFAAYFGTFTWSVQIGFSHQSLAECAFFTAWLAAWMAAYFTATTATRDNPIKRLNQRLLVKLRLARETRN